MKAIAAIAIAATMTTFTATASFAEKHNKMTAGTEDPYVAPVVAPPAGTMGSGVMPVIAGVAAAGIIAAAVLSDSDSSATHENRVGNGNGGEH